MLQARKFHLGFAVLLILLWGHFQVKSASGSEEELIGKGKVDIQLVSGPLFSSKIFGNGTPTTNCWQNGIRLGWILNSPKPEFSVLRGNFEAMAEFSHAVIFQGPGTYWVGITALLRYNFVPRESKWIPYVQAGAGVVLNDVYKDHSQDAIGQAIEFIPQASLGVRYFFEKKWSVDLEAAYRHISNAGLAERNVGLNFFGGFIGISYLF